MPHKHDVVYLHGFASSPQSNKAQFFRRKLNEQGVAVDIPRLDGGHFESLTISSQLKIVHETVAGRSVLLMGSSLGGYLAALYAARHPEIAGLVLLAPGFQFPSRWRQRYTPEELDRWKREGSTPVYHYGEKRELRLGHQLLEDSERYEDEPDARQPALIFHGTQDDVVPAEVSQAFVATHPNASLHLMDSGHELTDVLEPMWVKVDVFRRALC
ncbi:MAG: YqiA/YcfP family alpha/beta fold hydrolase [Acidobacteriota bacterium]